MPMCVSLISQCHDCTQFSTRRRMGISIWPTTILNLARLPSWGSPYSWQRRWGRSFKYLAPLSIFKSVKSSRRVCARALALERRIIHLKATTWLSLCRSMESSTFHKSSHPKTSYKICSNERQSNYDCRGWRSEQAWCQTKFTLTWKKSVNKLSKMKSRRSRCFQGATFRKIRMVSCLMAKTKTKHRSFTLIMMLTMFQ